jgi:DNA polymerase epsilon subunit 2
MVRVLVSHLRARGLMPSFHQDAAMKVSVEILNRVYQALQTSGDQRTRKEDGYLDPEDHLHIVDAFEMPRWHWSPERGSFEK